MVACSTGDVVHVPSALRAHAHARAQPATELGTRSSAAFACCDTAPPATRPRAQCHHGKPREESAFHMPLRLCRPCESMREKASTAMARCAAHALLRSVGNGPRAAAHHSEKLAWCAARHSVGSVAAVV